MEAGRTWPCKFGMKLKSAACLFRALYIVHWQYAQWVFVQFIFIRSGKKLLYWVLLARFPSMPILLWGGVEGITVIVVFKGLDFFFHLISFALKIFGFRFWCPLRFLCFPFFLVCMKMFGKNQKPIMKNLASQTKAKGYGIFGFQMQYIVVTRKCRKRKNTHKAGGFKFVNFIFNPLRLQRFLVFLSFRAVFRFIFQRSFERVFRVSCPYKQRGYLLVNFTKADSGSKNGNACFFF